MDVIDSGDDPQPRLSDGYLAPDVLAVTAFALSLVALMGFGILNGSLVLALFGGFDGQDRSALVGAALLGAAMAALPVAVGLAAVRRSLEDDPLWVGTLARAAVLLGSLAVVVRLGQAVVQGVADNPQFYGF